MSINRRDYIRSYQNKWIRNRRQKWLNENGPCKRCDSWDNLRVDHVDPSTKDPILKESSNQIWSWSEERRLKELAKCQVLCYPCHVKKTTDNEEFHSILTNKSILEIRELLNNESCTEIAKKYGVSRQAISDIKRGSRWNRK